MEGGATTLRLKKIGVVAENSRDSATTHLFCDYAYLLKRSVVAVFSWINYISG